MASWSVGHAIFPYLEEFRFFATTFEDGSKDDIDLVQSYIHSNKNDNNEKDNDNDDIHNHDVHVKDDCNDNDDDDDDKNVVDEN